MFGPEEHPLREDIKKLDQVIQKLQVKADDIRDAESGEKITEEDLPWDPTRTKLSHDQYVEVLKVINAERIVFRKFGKVEVIEYVLEIEDFKKPRIVRQYDMSRKQ